MYSSGGGGGVPKRTQAGRYCNINLLVVSPFFAAFGCAGCVLDAVSCCGNRLVALISFRLSIYPCPSLPLLPAFS